MVAGFGVSTLLCGSDCSFSVSWPSLPPSSGAFWPFPRLLLALGGALHFPNPFLSFFFIIFLLLCLSPRLWCLHASRDV